MMVSRCGSSIIKSLRNSHRRRRYLTHFMAHNVLPFVGPAAEIKRHLVLSNIFARWVPVFARLLVEDNIYVGGNNNAMKTSIYLVF